MIRAREIPTAQAKARAKAALEKARAKAKLEKAAPALLAACQRVMQLSVSAGSEEIFTEVRAAIGKATV